MLKNKGVTDYNQFQFKDCEACGSKESAIIRHWNKKVLCSKCAEKSFNVFMRKLLAGLGSVALLTGFILLFN